MKTFRLRYRKQDLALGPEEVSIGRAEDSGLVIDDPSVSRRHASFRLVDNVPCVFDAGSRNGVRVNGVKIDAKKHLRDGDVVAIGSHEITVTCSAGTSAPTRIREDAPTRPATNPEVAAGTDAVFWRKVDAQFLAGEIVGAEKSLSEYLHRVLIALRNGSEESASLKLPTRYSIRLAIATRKSVWIDWVFQAHETALAVVPAETVDELHGAIRKIEYRLSTVLRRYMETLRARSSEMNASERFAMQRLEGLFRMLSGGATGRLPARR